MLIVRNDNGKVGDKMHYILGSLVRKVGARLPTGIICGVHIGRPTLEPTVKELPSHARLVHYLRTLQDSRPFQCGSISR